MPNAFQRLSRCAWTYLAVAAGLALGAATAAAEAVTPAPLPVLETRTDTPSGLPVPRFVSVKAPRANVRQGPSTTHTVEWIYVRKGIPVEIIAETQNWRRIRDLDGREGWVHANMLDGERTAIITGAELVPLRKKPDATSDTTAWAEPGLIAKLKACNANWCEVSAQSAKGWLPRTAVWGVLPTETFE